MFADSILEDSWARGSRRSWTTITSFALQAAVVIALLILPLIRPVGLPFLKPLTTPVLLAPPPGLPPAAQLIQHLNTRLQSNMINMTLIAPQLIPRQILNVEEAAAPPQFMAGVGVYGGNGLGDPRGVPGALAAGANPVMPAPPAPALAATHLRVSRMMEGNLVRRVQPDYPPLAKMARIQGVVVLAALIGKEGKIENVKVVAGHPMLVQAALEAVKQWRYRPYLLNDEPVEVETQITVNFSLSGN